MKRLVLLTLLTATPAFAQNQPSRDMALTQEIMACVGEKVQLRARVNDDDAEIARLKIPPAPAKPE